MITSKPDKLAAAAVFAVAWGAERTLGFVPVAAALLFGFIIELQTIRVSLKLAP